MKKSTIATSISSFFFLHILYSPSQASKLNTTISTMPLPTFVGLPYSNSSSKMFDHFAYVSQIGARSFKKQKSNPYSYNFPLFVQKDAAFIKLSFGTPPQTLRFMLDTGDSLTWFPCERRIFSHNGPFSNKEASTFYPRISSSSKYLSCSNPKYQWFISKKHQDYCQNCKQNNSENCSSPIDYQNKYVGGSSSGLLLSETLNMPQYAIENFIVGCSTSFTIPYAIVGLGRGFESLPSQIGATKFSYCLSAKEFTTKPQKSYFYLNDDLHSKGLSYIPFSRIPSTNVFKRSYYLVLKDIIVGNKVIPIPKKFLVPRYDGYGGTIIDSGTTYTTIENGIFQVVTREFLKQLGGDAYTVNMEPMRFCFHASGKKPKNLPELAFQFEGGATMKLASHNYLTYGRKSPTSIDIRDVMCLSIKSKANGSSFGPTITLGNVQQRNFYMEYDLDQERLGFRAEKCK